MQHLIDRMILFLLKKKIRGSVRLRNTFIRSRRVQTTTKHGIRLWVDPYEGIDSTVIIEGFYEEEVYRAVSSQLRSGDVFWDIGSNLGLHALTVKHKHPSVDVTAFEPNPEMEGLLQRTAKENSLDVQILPFAMAAENGTADFFIHKGNSGRCGLYNRDDDPALPSVEVKTVSGDSIVDNGIASPPNVIKIDVEGHEFAALQGLADLLAKSSLRAIIFEDVPGSSDVKDLLSSHGFTFKALSRMESTNHSLENYLASRAVVSEQGDDESKRSRAGGNLGLRQAG